MKRSRGCGTGSEKFLVVVLGLGSLFLTAATWPVDSPNRDSRAANSNSTNSAPANRLVSVIVYVGNSGVTETPTIPVPPPPPSCPDTGTKGSGTMYRSPLGGDHFTVNLLNDQTGNPTAMLDELQAGEGCDGGGGGGGGGGDGCVLPGPGSSNPSCKKIVIANDDMSGTGGCTSCGGGSAGSIECPTNVMMQVPPLSFTAVFRPQKTPNFGGGLAPGMELQVWGSNVHVGKNTESGANEIVIQVNDTTSGEVRNFFDGTGGSADGVCYDKQKQVKTAELKTGGVNGTLTTSMTSADSVVMTYYSGVRMEFELWTVAHPLEGADEKKGRLTAVKDKNGRGATIAYSQNPPTAYSTVDAYKISTITDAYGAQLSVSYGSNQSSQAAISSVTFPNGQQATMTYSGNKLNEINMAEDWKFKIAYTSNQTAQTTVATVNHPATGTRAYHLTQDYINYDGGLLNQPLNVLRYIEDGNGDDVIAIFQNPSNGNQYRVLYGNDSLSFVQAGEYENVYTTWTFGTPSQGYSGFTNLTLPSTPMPANLFTGGSSAETIKLGQPPEYRDEYGGTVDVLYDSEGFVTKKTYDDGTFEEWGRDSNKNLTRYRDRMARVTLWEYDSNYNMTKMKVGILVVSGTDTNQAEYAEYRWAYFSSGYLQTAFSPLNTTQTDLYRTDYTYTSSNLLEKIIQSADAASGTRPETEFTWDSYKRLVLITDPLERETSFGYDNLSRRVQISYDDSSTEQIKFGAGGTTFQADMIVGRKNRANVVDTTSFDSSGRGTTRVQAGALDSDIRDGQSYATTVTDPLKISTTTFTYLAGTGIAISSITDGRKVDRTLDYKRRPITSTVYPSSGASLTTDTVYVDNRVFYSEDPYGRRRYMGYSATNGTELIRVVQTNHPSYTLSDNTAVLNLSRSSSANAAFVIDDAIRDAEGKLVEVIDGRGTSTTVVYDSRAREVQRRNANGAAIEAKTETLYDVAGHVIEIRSPRYFDSGDSGGYNLAKAVFTYNGRGLQVTQVVTLSSGNTATTSSTYYLDGKEQKRTDPRSYDWYSYWDGCCGRTQGTKDPAGHGSFSNLDYMGRNSHLAIVSDYASHTDNHNPTDSKTYSEATTRFDALGRMAAITQWLSVRGTIDPNAVSIAGLDGVSASDGITSQTIYDSNLSDGTGLDSTGGVTVNKLGGGTFAVSLSACLGKLDDATSSGGGGITFATNSAGSAVVSINPNEEISVSISDGTGRSVMNAVIEGPAGSSPNALITWTCMKYDTITNISGFGDCLETQSIDALGKIAKSLADGSGRTLKTIDAESNASTAEFDANGNTTKSRDPNGVGYDAVYDVLNRQTSSTDTWGDEVATTYDRAGNVTTQVDAKDKTTTFAYDAANRRTSVTDRISGVTEFTYDAASNQLTINDAEDQTTSYGYDSRGNKVSETYPDHSGGSSGDSSYGIVAFSYNPAGREELKTDQNGDTVTIIYDLAGRTTQRDYRLKANSPSGTIADSNTFTFDKSSRMLTAVSGRYSNTVTNTYDIGGRLKDESLTIGGQTYTTNRIYDVRGQLDQLTYPDSSLVEKAYTDRGQLYTTKYRSGSGGTLYTEDTRTYDAGGRESTSAFRNGVTAGYAYRSSGSNKDNLLASISFTHPEGVTTSRKVGDHTYTWDANKNKTKEAIAGQIPGYSFDTTLGSDPDGYDDDDRLTYWKRQSISSPQTWSLTAVRDWSSWSNFGTSQSRTHGAAHEILTAGSSPNHTIVHDVKGNITEIPTNISSPARKLFWDFDNQLTGVDTTGDSTPEVTNKYDALHRRVSRTESSATVVYVSSGQQIVADYTSGASPSSTPLYRYVWGDYVDAPILRQTGSTTLYYYHRNQQFSTTAITDYEGKVRERYGYTAYGEPTFIAASGTTQAWTVNKNRYTYTGREWDDSVKMFYFRARWYEPLLGRFLSRDPFGFVDGMNVYAGYLSLNGQDPQGLQSEPCPTPYCLRDFSRASFDIKSAFPTLFPILKWLGFDSLKFKWHLDWERCCECCNGTNERTFVTVTGGALLEIAVDPQGIFTPYVRGGFSFAFSAWTSRCHGSGGGGCATLSFEIGLVLKLKTGVWGAGFRCGVHVKGTVCAVVQGQTLKFVSNLCISIRCRAFGNIGWWEFGRDYVLGERCTNDMDIGGGVSL